MPTVLNPSKFHLWCEPADQEIQSGKTITVSEAVAARVSTCVFVVNRDAPVETKVEKAPATRKTVTRGGKQAEVTEAPAAETRAW